MNEIDTSQLLTQMRAMAAAAQAGRFTGAGSSCRVR